MDDVDMHLSRCPYLNVKVRGAAEMPSPDEAAIEGKTGSRPTLVRRNFAQRTGRNRSNGRAGPASDYWGVAEMTAPLRFIMRMRLPPMTTLAKI